MAFNPQNGSYFWSNGYQYGTVDIQMKGGESSVNLTSMNGDLDLSRFTLNDYGQISFRKGKIIEEGESFNFLITRD